MTEEITVVLVAPVPVGHRVQVRWYEEVLRGLVPGQERRDGRPSEPVIEDLDTGITYQSEWPVGASRRRSPDEPYELGAMILPDHQLVRTLEGICSACRVVTIRGYPDLEVQTHLQISTT